MRRLRPRAQSSKRPANLDAAFDAPEPDERKHRSADQDVEYWEDVG